MHNDSDYTDDDNPFNETLTSRRLASKAANNAAELMIQDTQASLPMTPKDAANTNGSSSSVDC